MEVYNQEEKIKREPSPDYFIAAFQARNSHSGRLPRPQFILSINNISVEKQELIPCVILYNFIISDVGGKRYKYVP